MPEIDIETRADEPKKAQSDSGSTEQHSLKDLIDADKYSRQKNAGAKSFFSLVKICNDR